MMKLRNTRRKEGVGQVANDDWELLTIALGMMDDLSRWLSRKGLRTKLWGKDSEWKTWKLDWNRGSREVGWKSRGCVVMETQVKVSFQVWVNKQWCKIRGQVEGVHCLVTTKSFLVTLVTKLFSVKFWRGKDS